MRRLAALVGIFLVLALAVALLWRVWAHHNETFPLDDEESAVVTLVTSPAQFVKIASDLS